MKNISRILTAGVLVLALSGCGYFGDDDKPKKDLDQRAGSRSSYTHETSPICPQVAIIRALGSMSDYGVEKPSPSELVGAVRMDNVAGDCAYIEGGIDVTFKLTLAGVRGPRLGGNMVSFPYFVAIVDPTETILDKKRLTAEVKFESSAMSTSQDEELHVFIPLSKDKKRSGPNYQVLMGFQLTAEERALKE